MDGIIVVHKEKGFTSFDVVAKLRGILKQKKIGHTGTLDPDATGVLPVCLGCATKLCDMLTDTTKVYEAELLLGVTTDTQDTSGTVLEERAVTVTEEEVRAVIASFMGEQKQIPPMYSALKVDGKKLYELAREGKTVERKARDITIGNIEILEVNLPKVRMVVTCSKGTYIRTLCNDIGDKLGCGGAMASLIRRKTAGFTLEEAKTLDEIEALMKAGEIATVIKGVDTVFTDCLKAVVKEDYMKAVQNGNWLYPDMLLLEADNAEPEDAGNHAVKAETVKVEDIRVYGTDGIFYGVYGYEPEKKAFKPKKMFFYKVQ